MGAAPSVKDALVQPRAAIPATASRLELIAEFVILFFGLPLGFLLSPVRLHPIPVLWCATAYCFWRIWKDESFDRKQLWNRHALRSCWAQILLIFVLLATMIAIGVDLFAPQRLFIMVRRAPWIWLLVMALYPPLSVYPQGIIYRAFFFQRYQSLFKNRWLMIAISALVFSFVHIVFRNWLAVIFTLFGGVLFAWRYASTRSLYTSAFEHALYGCFLFTIGLGEFFYKGPR
jgi:membrane protease YdiL (CAAX protease family)